MTEHPELAWHKSSYSGGGNGNCVEIAHTQEGIAVRDSKTPHTGNLDITGAGWRAFLRSVR